MKQLRHLKGLKPAPSRSLSIAAYLTAQLEGLLLWSRANKNIVYNGPGLIELFFKYVGILLSTRDSNLILGFSASYSERGE